MSSIENQPVVDAVSEIKDKKPKKPTLSAKYQKFMIFGYAFVKQLQEANLLVDDNSLDVSFTQLRLFASVEDQTQFYSNFLDESSATGKLMRKFIQDKNKPPKGNKKPRAPRKKADVSVSEGEDQSQEKPPAKVRKPRAKKSITVVNDTENNIIGQLVAAAQNEEPVVTPVVVAEKKPRKKAVDKVTPTPVEVPTPVEPVEETANTEVKETEKKDKKPRKKAESKTDSVETDKKEKKPRKKAEPKTKTNSVEDKKTTETKPLTNELVNEPIVETKEEEEDEIHTREFVLNGVSYLIDDDNNVYSVDESHDHIGVYNATTKKIESV